MRIAQICPYSLSLPGGVQAQALGLAHALSARGHHVRVLAPCDGPPPSAFVTPLGASLPRSVNGSIAPIAPDASCALRTLQVLRSEEFDVLHLHEPLSPGPTLTSLIAGHAPKIGTFHAAGAHTAYENLGVLTRHFAKRLHTRVAVSEDARRTAHAALGGEYRVLFNGVDVAAFQSVAQQKSSVPSIFFLGRHDARKGLPVLIDAMSFLPQDVALWIAGEGPLTSSLQELTRKDSRISWLGRVSEAEKVQRLRSAHVFCAPSLSGESFGIVLLEAMAAEVPIVASDLPGYRNVARDGRDAVLVPVGDERALGEALAETLASLSDEQAQRPGQSHAESTTKNPVQKKVQSGLQRAQQFSLSSLAERYEVLYQRACGMTS